MQSFRTEIENPIVERDILDLEKKIRLFKEGRIDEERFRSLRLARGVYGQRQQGVQMIRIKLPFGKVTGDQLLRISDVSDEYSTGKLHITTRQDIQIHYVDLNRTPQLWAELEKDDVTLREACGNTVRNITASETSGIDLDEPFDVSPYAHAVFQFFLRNPICQEMGRKFKISFSSSDEDSAISFIHDLGFIPRIEEGKRGFKVMLGGGLGSQPRHADVVYEFLPENKLIPVTESVLRIFDRHGERSRRLKARMKFLIKDIGLESFLELIEEEKKAISHQTVEIDISGFDSETNLMSISIPQVTFDNDEEYELWKGNNVFKQKQDGLFAIGIKVKLGDFSTEKARKLAHLVKDYAANELRFTLRQNILLRHVKEALLPYFFQELKTLGFTDLGYNATTDITACPGTDTCNLGIASSTGLADKLEEVLYSEYPNYVNNRDITIKISGCMNACGQHNMAHIGFQGMSIRTKDKLVAPAVQVLLGGGILGDGQGRFSDKVIKLPSKRGPEALRMILDDFESKANKNEPFLDYYDRQGQKYFYDFLNQLSDTDNLTESDFIDWGNNEKYIQAVGVGECAGVVIDLVATLLLEAKEKIDLAKESFEGEQWSDAVYHTYSSLVNAAKALLLSEDISTNTQANIIDSFEETFIEKGLIDLNQSFKTLIYQIRENEPNEQFAKKYANDALNFFDQVEAYRSKSLTHAS
ncbi:sulfite reductase (ferredoxin) [Flavobacteriaceae bacterium MAR_2010_188]|nr:sulfite reductase (ferredoxin) [Flavobacteriaceae bacterium MAR_2010_188]